MMTNWKENALICVKYYYATSFSTFSLFGKLSTILPNYWQLSHLVAALLKTVEYFNIPNTYIPIYETWVPVSSDFSISLTYLKIITKVRICFEKYFWDWCIFGRCPILRCVWPTWDLRLQSYERFEIISQTWLKLNLWATATLHLCSLQPASFIHAPEIDTGNR